MKDKKNRIDYGYGFLNVIIAVAVSILIRFCTQTHNSGIFCCTFLIQMALIFLYLKLLLMDKQTGPKGFLVVLPGEIIEIEYSNAIGFFRNYP